MSGYRQPFGAAVWAVELGEACLESLGLLRKILEGKRGWEAHQVFACGKVKHKERAGRGPLIIRKRCTASPKGTAPTELEKGFGLETNLWVIGLHRVFI